MPRQRISRVIVAVLLGAAAFAVTIQVRGTSNEEFSHLRESELVELLRSVEGSSNRVEQQLRERSALRDELRAASEDSQAAADEAKKRADDVAILAGTVPTVGPGIFVRIVDQTGAVDANVLLDTMSELRDGGAEAISINRSIRVVAHTYFLDEAGGPSADGTLIASPMVIEAIGDPATLQSSLSFPGGLVDKIESRGAKIVIEVRERVEITAVTQAQAGRYARVRPTGEE